MNVTLLKEEQIWGDNPLQVIDNYGARIGLSDLAVVLGGYLDDNNRTVEGDASGCIWTSAVTNDYKVRVVDSFGHREHIYPNVRRCAVCPVLPVSATKSISSSKQREQHLNNGNVLDIIEYGEYPQSVVSKELTVQLEEALDSKSLLLTGKHYTFDSADLREYGVPFQPMRYEEYEYKGERYVRVMSKSVRGCSRLSNGESVNSNSAYWLKVEPIQWRKDPTGVWVSHKALVAGIQFNADMSYDGHFNDTNMRKYLNTYFVNEMQPPEICVTNKNHLSDAMHELFMQKKSHRK